LSLGTLSALKEYTLIDRVVMVSSFFFLSIPPFWLGLILLYIFGFQLRLFPLDSLRGQILYKQSKIRPHL
jgi:peptide/nickel transport system permease protein